MSSSEFVAAADAFVAALAQFRTETNTVGAQASTDAVTAANASASAVASATMAQSSVSSAGTNSTSTTSLTSGTGTKSFTINATGQLYVPGQYLCMASAANPSNQMIGIVTSYSGTSLVVNALTSQGSAGPWADWVISLAAFPATSIAALTDYVSDQTNRANALKAFAIAAAVAL
jgi:hypothetical protein